MSKINHEALQHAIATSIVLNPRKTGIDFDDALELITAYVNAADASDGGVSNFRRTADWLAAAGKQVGNKDHLSVQVGVHLEEVAEFLDAITFESTTGLASGATVEVSAVLKGLANSLKLGGAKVEIYDREAALDALCDQEVTANGVAYLAGFDKEGADAEVLRANDSKLEDGKAVILEGGKIGKGKDYTPPNILPFIGDTVLQ